MASLIGETFAKRRPPDALFRDCFTDFSMNFGSVFENVVVQEPFATEHELFCYSERDVGRHAWLTRERGRFGTRGTSGPKAPPGPEKRRRESSA